MVRDSQQLKVLENKITKQNCAWVQQHDLSGEIFNINRIQLFDSKFPSVFPLLFTVLLFIIILHYLQQRCFIKVRYKKETLLN